MSDFDFDSWLADAHLPETTVSLYKRDHSDRLEQIEDELDRDDLGADDRLGSKSERARLAEEYQTLRDDMEASRFDVRLRMLTASELADLKDLAAAKAKAEAKGIERTTMAEQLAMQTLAVDGREDFRPTAEQWRMIADAAGAFQWERFCERVNSWSIREVRTPDFSQTVSEILRTETS